MQNRTLALALVLAIALVGCGDTPTKAPPITAKVKEWKDMSQQEKIETIQKQPMPQQAKDAEIAKIRAGQS